MNRKPVQEPTPKCDPLRAKYLCNHMFDKNVIIIRNVSDDKIKQIVDMLTQRQPPHWMQ